MRHGGRGEHLKPQLQAHVQTLNHQCPILNEDKLPHLAFQTILCPERSLYPKYIGDFSTANEKREIWSTNPRERGKAEEKISAK